MANHDKATKANASYAARQGGKRDRKPNARARRYNPRERQMLPAAALQPCITNKAQYPDRSAADKALAQIAGRRERDLRLTGTTTWNQIRHYRCPYCAVLHLTSAEDLWFAAEVAEDLWQEALAHAAQQRKAAVAQADVQSTNQDDWDVAA